MWGWGEKREEKSEKNATRIAIGREAGVVHPVPRRLAEAIIEARRDRVELALDVGGQAGDPRVVEALEIVPLYRRPRARGDAQYQHGHRNELHVDTKAGRPRATAAGVC